MCTEEKAQHAKRKLIREGAPEIVFIVNLLFSFLEENSILKWFP